MPVKVVMSSSTQLPFFVAHCSPHTYLTRHYAPRAHPASSPYRSFHTPTTIRFAPRVAHGQFALGQFRRCSVTASPTAHQPCMKAEAAASAPGASDLAALSSVKQQIRKSVEGLNCGLDIDPDAEVMDDNEAQVETLIEQLEDMNESLPTSDLRMTGSWNLLYTSSTITRYSGGLTGLHRVFPEGSVSAIRQVIDIDDGTANFEEDINFDLPFVDKHISLTAFVTGRIRQVGDIRHLWDPQTVRLSFFSWFADGWKATRAFKAADTTFLDEDFLVTRGQTGSVCLYARYS